MYQFEDNSVYVFDFNKKFNENLRIFIHGIVCGDDLCDQSRIVITAGPLNVPYERDEQRQFNIED